MQRLEQWIIAFRDFLWDPYFLGSLLVATGLLMTLLLKFIQIRRFGHGINLCRGIYDDPNDPGEVTHFQALSSALSSTVGTGNIAGVATAIAAGGPGAIFWMWITGFVGMAAKYAECMLGLKYREITPTGIVRGGPMYYIQKGLGASRNKLVAGLGRPLAIFFACCMIITPLIGGNMVQANSAAHALNANFGIPKAATGLVLAIFVGIVIIGGIRRIGKVTSKLVPFMGVVYTIGVLILLAMNWTAIPAVLRMIFYYAFNPTAAIGGFAGAAVTQSISYGFSRGVFSNEAGLGSAPIAHAAAKTKEPVREGLVAMMGPMFDTLGINTLTALAVLCTGAWKTGESGAALTSIAFDRGLPGQGGYIVAVAMTLFALSTAITQSYYGNRAFDFLFGERPAAIYRWFFAGLHFVGAIVTLRFVWALADVANGLQAFPNLLTLILLSGSIVAATREYFSRPQIPHKQKMAMAQAAGTAGK